MPARPALRALDEPATVPVRDTVALTPAQAAAVAHLARYWCTDGYPIALDPPARDGLLVARSHPFEWTIDRAGVVA